MVHHEHKPNLYKTIFHYAYHRMHVVWWNLFLSSKVGYHMENCVIIMLTVFPHTWVLVVMINSRHQGIWWSRVQRLWLELPGCLIVSIVLLWCWVFVLFYISLFNCLYAKNIWIHLSRKEGHYEGAFLQEVHASHFGIKFDLKTPWGQ